MVAYTRADLLFQRGEFEAAETAFRQLTGDPELGSLAPAGVTRSLLARARQLVERRRYREAMPLLQESLAIEETAAGHLNLGICLHGLRDANAAYREYAAAVDLDPANPITYFQMGMLMVDCGEAERAAAAFAQTLTVDPDYPEARHRLASMQALLGNFEAAVNVLRPEVERKPDCPECHSLLSVAYISLGNPNAALPHLEATVRLKPDDFVAHYNLATMHVLAGRYADAIPHLERARAIDPELFAEGWTTHEQFAAVRDLEAFRSFNSPEN
jgi:tetratricopeptide (TPR) repeat protein